MPGDGILLSESQVTRHKSKAVMRGVPLHRWRQPTARCHQRLESEDAWRADRPNDLFTFCLWCGLLSPQWRERNTPLSTLVSGVKTPPQETSVGEDDGTQKPFHRECFYVTGTRLSLITTSSPLVTVFDWEVVMGGESRSWSRGTERLSG
jgi:hypothetical protein